MQPEVAEVTEITESLREAFARLMPQLSPRLGAPAAGRLEALLASPSAVLLEARYRGRIVGVLTLVWYDTPSGRKAWIEDVVVDAAARGCGAGRALVAAALERAAAEGVGRVMLTSAPRRVTARALYRKMGFEEAETNVFVLKMDRK